MKEVINLPGPTAVLRDGAVPEPNDDQVLIKVVVSGSNPKDWKVPEVAKSSDSPLFARYAHVREGVNQGDDIAGVVEKVGKNVVEFKPGDRVGAFHEMLMPGGSYAEYALAWAHTTFHLPKETSFEEAATIPLAGLTAVVALYHHLALPFPWRPAKANIPLVIYGGSTAVGSFAIKLARRSNIHPIIAVAGKGATYIQQFLDPSQGDCVVDYRNGAEATVKGIRSALKADEVNHVLDTVVHDESTHVLKSVIAPGGNINSVLPQHRDVSPGVASNTWVNSAHDAGGPDDCRELCYLFCRWISRELHQGTFSGHPFEVRAGGLAGVQDALKDLMENKASAVKYVFRIADTPGL
ncbi:chaperonin 10-like protein [Aspergillus ambiguus]|uniref:zinc-binding alcohol dehydrogenase family protein n=1 Tax=Aspergillus ambiguus TaxID=176160 RepID=UPI003CCDEEDE